MASRLLLWDKVYPARDKRSSAFDSGSSSAKAFFNAVRQAEKLVRGGVTEKIAAAVQTSKANSTEEKIG